MKTLKQVLIDRDEISSDAADILIQEAKDAMNEYLEEDDFESAHNVCEEFFGLEPDYIMDLME